MTDTYQPVDEFDSMTENTFIVLPQSAKGPQKGNKDRTPPEKAAEAQGPGYVRLLQGKEPVESMLLRKRLFNETWRPLEKQLMEIEQQSNNAGITEICDFVDTSYKQIDSKEKGQLACPFAEITTAVTFTGVNTGDHSKLFESLQTRLAERGHHVALVESQYCTTLPNMLKSILEQMYASIHASTDEDKVTGPAANPLAKSIAYDMGLLEIWWTVLVGKRPDTSADRIVVILQDFEGFSPMVVDDFVHIATRYCHTIPIVLVLGLATSYECIHQSLTKPTISMLNVERFNLQRSKQCIDAAIYNVFVQGTSMLAFGAEAYKSLIDQFLLYDFSITGFVKKLKYAVMDFFYAQPLSILAAMVVADKDGGRLSLVSECPVQLTRGQAELVRMQISVRAFLERRLKQTGDSQYFQQAIASDRFLQETVLPEMLRQLISYRQGYCLGIDMLSEIQSLSPESLQKPIRTLHYYGISQPFEDCVHWKTLSAVVRRMKACEMGDLISSLRSVVSRAGSVDWGFSAEKGVDIQELLDKAEKLLENPEENEVVDIIPSNEPKKRIRTRTDMESRPFILFDSESSDHMLRALDRCCTIVETVLGACIQPYHSAPLYEIFYYRHSFLLDTTFSAQPRAAVQTALGRTNYYVNCECCKTAGHNNSDNGSDDETDVDAEAEENRILPSMHDTSIAYRLHQECGRLINLYDWFSAFSSVVEKEAVMRPRAAPSQSEIQARFMRTVEEMRFLGFIKPTQRKTDHVVRLTWGA
ncbi:Origin recognition complex subunit 3 [Coemansia sp. RSA 1813]|nr:Origin recognition complex subunit 3 [Coemansia sp. RSA 1813]